FAVAGSLPDKAQLVVIFEPDSNQAVSPHRGKIAQVGPFNLTVAGSHNQVFGVVEAANRQDASNRLVLGYRKQVDNWQALGGAARIRDFVGFKLEDPPFVGEEKQAIE